MSGLHSISIGLANTNGELPAYSLCDRVVRLPSVIVRTDELLAGAEIAKTTSQFIHSDTRTSIEVILTETAKRHPNSFVPIFEHNAVEPVAIRETNPQIAAYDRHRPDESQIRSTGFWPMLDKPEFVLAKPRLSELSSRVVREHVD